MTEQPKTLEEVFTAHFERNRWGAQETVSGKGSTMEATHAIRVALTALLEELKPLSVLDAPCGEYHWQRFIAWAGTRYIGLDIVRGIITQNQSKHPETYGIREFVHGDLTRGPLPEADMVLCRDGLVHLSHRDAMAAVSNILATGCRYIVATHFPDVANLDIKSGGWRPLNMTAEPFGWPEPERTIDEEWPGAPFKTLGVWRAESIRSTHDAIEPSGTDSPGGESVDADPADQHP